MMLFYVPTIVLGLVAAVYAAATGTPSASSSAQSTSASSSFSAAVLKKLGTCTPVSSGAAIPRPSNGLNLLQVGPKDAPYDVSQSDLLASISFPNGLNCRSNLVILFPGTAVPALDTFTSTFIPVFKPQSVADADVMVITIPSVSLGDAQTTAEYAAFAINYAALVLGRRATIIPWSQGNLNTQWALKYWPSTRLNLKNYAGMSPDYDGTLDASFLCNPEKLLTGNLATLATNFLTNAGSGTSLEALLGIGALPTSAEQFKLYLLALLSGDLPNLSSSASTSKAAAAATIAKLGTRSHLDSAFRAVDPLMADGVNNLPKRKAIPFGQKTNAAETKYLEAQIEARIKARALSLATRQINSGNPSALAQLVNGLAALIAKALTALAVKPTSILEEILKNYAGNLGSLEIPALLPQGCLPSIWQQVYQSNFVNTLATDYGNGRGDSVFVPTTTVFSLTDEIVQPQGATGYETASGYLTGASNIFIQGNGGCPVVPSVLISGLPTVITHEGVLYSGMGVAVAVAAVKSGGTVSPSSIDATVRCSQVSPLLTPQQAVAQEATIPGALARILLGGGTSTLGFTAAEPPIKSYAYRKF